MPALLSTLLVGLSLLSPAVAWAGSTTQIAVTGTGSVSLTPDQVIVNGTVETYDGHSAAVAVSNNAVGYSRVVAAIVAAGIDRNDISLLSYNVNYTAPPNDRSGYTVDRSFQVKTQQIGLAGKVVDAAISAGATQIDSVSFGVADTAAALREAGQRAIADARAEADAIAAAAHLHVVGVDTITVENAYIPSPRPVITSMRLATIAAAPTSFETGTYNVTQTVNVVFLAKP
jgi:uncharacterized protein